MGWEGKKSKVAKVLGLKKALSAMREVWNHNLESNSVLFSDTLCNSPQFY